MKKILNQALYGALLLLGIASPALVFAQTGVSVQANVTTNAQAGKISAAITRADKEIDRRIAALTELSARVSAMTRVTVDFKNTLNTSVQTQISDLQTLKTKIDASTDIESLKVDIQSITSGYRIYALVLPQTRIAVAADRIVTITTMMAGVGGKLQARIQALPQSTSTAAMAAALTDMAAKMASAQTQAQAAVTATVSLTPDNGDKTKAAANLAALKDARTKLQAAQKDIKAARADIELILKGLKAAAGTTATTTPQQ